MARRPLSKVKKRINSRTKGAVGEREFADLLKSMGLEARRGQQFSGGKDSPDVVHNLTGVHFEVKRVQAGNPYNWLDQACRDCGKGAIPIVAHRKNNRQWMAILPMEAMLGLLILREGTIL